MKKILQKLDSDAIIIFFICAFCFEFIISLQGIDLTDEGAALSNYQQIFRAPQYTEYWFLYYLTIVVGGIWNLIFGHFGMLGFRLFNIIVILFSEYLVYKTLKRYINKYLIIGCLSFYLIILNADISGIIVFQYYSCSMLISCVIAYFLSKSLTDKSDMDMLLASFFAGIAPFTRFPSITLFALPFILIIVQWLYCRNNMRKSLLMYVSGLILGILSVFVLMLCLGHIHIFANSLHNVYSILFAHDSTHSSSSILHEYLRRCCIILKYVFGIILLFVVLFYSERVKIFSTRINKILYGIIYIGILLCCIFTIGNYNFYNIHIVYALCTSPVIVYLFLSKNKLNKKTYICYISLLILYLLPLGSDQAMGNMGIWSILFSVPVSFACIFDIMKRFKSFNEIRSKYLYLSVAVLCAAFLFKSIILITNGCFLDYGSRKNKIYKIDSPLANTYVGSDKKEEIDKVLSAISQYVKKDDVLFCFQSMPMINYLTETKPYLYNNWPWCYGSYLMKLKMDQEIKEEKCFPVVIRQKCDPLGGTCMTPDTNWNKTNMPDTYKYKSGQIADIQYFLNRGKYKVVWQDKLFQILLPKGYRFKENG